MNIYLESDLTKKIFDSNPLNLKKTFYEIELYYLIRECLNMADLGRVADVGENAMMTGVSEYDRETYLIFQEVQKKYWKREKITKTELFEILKAIIGKAFVPDYVDNVEGKLLGQSIYNEIFKIEQRQGRSTLPSNPFKLEEYEFSITTQNEFMKYIDGRGAT
ncbi:MAG: hypothetical protein IPM97_08425 [Bdellovibrionaceae bacterium]|nr:hypothetical protein [Pseudobdellovibrionaceae bacterium]